MRICVMIEGQEGVRVGAMASPGRNVRELRVAGVVSIGTLSLDRQGEPAGELDAWETLAALAAPHRAIRLGTMVSPVTFRPPAVLAKNVVTVDHISGGRVELGIGAGWYEAEHTSYGFPFEATRDFRRARSAASRDHTPVDRGRHVRPEPLQRPRPPIIVGGRAKPRTLAAVFRSRTNTTRSSRPLTRRARGAERLAGSTGRGTGAASLLDDDRVCHDETRARSPSVSQLACSTKDPGEPPLSGTIDAVVTRLKEYEAVGVQRAMLQHLDHEDLEMVSLLGEVAAQLAS